MTTKKYIVNGIEVRLDDLGALDESGRYHRDWQISVDGILDKSAHRLIDSWFANGYAGMELDEYLDQLLEKK